MGGIFSVAARMKHIFAPATPPAGESILYFKSDGLPYCKDPSGTERPLIDIPPSLHENPTFDQVSSGKPLSWSDFWMGGGSTLASDAVDRVAGSSARVDHISGANGRLQETNAHGLNDTQVINFGFWAKAGVACTVGVEQVTNTTSAGATYFASGAVTSGRDIAVTTAWKRYTVSFTVPAGHLFGRFSMFPRAGTATTSIWYDESFSSATEASVGGGSVPPGVIHPYGPSGAAPAGYLKCDGTVYNIADYTVLGGLLAATYGGDGVTTFGVPDLRSRFPLGAGTLASLAGTEGQATESLRSTAHTHTAASITVGQTGSGHTHGIPNAGSPATFATPNTGANDVPRAAFFTTHNHGGDTTSTGSGHTHNTGGSVGASQVTGTNHAVPFLSVQYVIKT